MRSIYVSGTNCTLNLDNAVIKDNVGTNYGGVRMSGTGTVVNISGNTQITGNTNRSGTASNLIVSSSGVYYRRSHWGTDRRYAGKHFEGIGDRYGGGPGMA